MSALSAEHVYKVFGRSSRQAVEELQAGSSREDVARLGTAAVIDASFDVRQGETFVVMGLSGSGKSTLLRMLNGLLPLTSGHITIGGQDLADLSEKDLRTVRREKISMVFQHFALLPHRSVLANAAYPLEIQGVDKQEREEKALRALELTGLKGWETSMPSALSGGMQQRVGLARALTADTDILLMDEAFSALDPLIRRDMQVQLLDLQASLGKTIVFITHDLNEAMFLGDRIAVMRDGRIDQIGTAEEILSDPANSYVARFVSDVDRSRVLTAESLVESPPVVIRPGDGLKVALRLLNDAKVEGAYVVESGTRRLLGSVYAEELATSLREGTAPKEASRKVSDGFIHPDDSAVQPGTTLNEMFAASVEARLPLAVTSEDGIFQGIVRRVAMLQALAGGSETDAAPDSPEEVTGSTADDQDDPQKDGEYAR
ncbi:glycine betaine/L-proline ABC transporter ATP-binding protein [Actinomyces sp. 2119]|uniref:Glycine betaine/L-proline ABC transporter ATP-binding protein n=1 Tax=Actinomyces lilanjuaniae TaxID=2321394 RepID=A0ABN5PPP5_9ACTO|nr:glycine betaine/L-proline ABC transporter ATP-binding protein [Actinomyces sp. 2119]AYD90373.1 glycine betaine/L-proline ABC transporter ATP-binding protein [Actinomyces lilanjuaniae]RJF40953.1 glycine betaine/L-proline ABC transporter ATP-binding protein [Actinomyces sp. 2119]